MKKRILNGFFLAALAGSSPWLLAAEPTSGEKIEQGLQNVKEGTKEVAKEVGAAAEKVGEKAVEAGRKVGQSFKAATCPVVGNRKTKLYYASDSKSYEEILSGQKYFEDDDRACFMTEKSARDEGYTRSAQ